MIDGAVRAAAATGEMVATIARAGPFGAGNPEPVMALPAHTLAYAEEVGQAHIRARLRAGDGRCSTPSRSAPPARSSARRSRRARGQAVHAAGTLSSTAGTAPSGCKCG